MSTKRLISYEDLQARGIVASRVALKSLIHGENFPPGIYLGKNTRRWDESEVDAWLANRPAAGPGQYRPALRGAAKKRHGRKAGAAPAAVEA